jgi:hypothetical protein
MRVANRIVKASAVIFSTFSASMGWHTYSVVEVLLVFKLAHLSFYDFVQILACQSDLVIRIVNEFNIVLKSVEDYSGNWRGGLERCGLMLHVACCLMMNEY